MSLTPDQGRRRARGISTVELVVTVSIAGTLLAWAIPGFGTLLDGVRVARASSALSVDLAQARMQAVGIGRPVTVCATLDQHACAGAADWGRGWMVYVENDRTGTREPDERLLSAVRRDDPVRVTGAAGRRRVTFQADGTSGGSNTTFHVCAPVGSTAQGRRIVVSNVGRIRAIERVAAADCG